MKMNGTTERDREATERRLLETVGELVREKGFERIGVNAVAERAGVSKILIYRYFGSVDGLLAAYVRRNDFWLNLPQELPPREQLPACLKAMFRAQIERLRTDATLRRLYRWELTADNPLIDELRSRRERIGRELIAGVARATGRGQAQVAVAAAMVSASVTYLALLADGCPVYNGIDLREDAGWERIARQIDREVDRLFE